MQAMEAGCELKLWQLAMFNTGGLNYLSENCVLGVTARVVAYLSLLFSYEWCVLKSMVERQTHLQPLPLFNELHKHLNSLG